VVTAYLLTFGGMMLLGGRLGDTIGRKRAFIIGVTLFTIASAICGIAWDGGSLIVARGLHGAAAAILATTCLALVATTFPKGPLRNAATAVFGATGGVGTTLGLVVGGALTEVWWRLAFLVNVPIGLLTIYLAGAALRETQKERMRFDAAGAVLAMLACTAAVFGVSVRLSHPDHNAPRRLVCLPGVGDEHHDVALWYDHGLRRVRGAKLVECRRLDLGAAAVCLCRLGFAWRRGTRRFSLTVAGSLVSRHPRLDIGPESV
jgi:MFS family permease